MKHPTRLFHALMLMTGLLCAARPRAAAQQLLNKKLSLRLQDVPVASVLKQLSRQGGFYFSYNSNIIPGDSIASMNVHQKTVRHILDTLFDGQYEYRETGNYIIIRPRQYNGHAYILSGRVLNMAGRPVPDASIYERTQFVSTLSDPSGSFRLRLRENAPQALITVSKAGYHDTSFAIHSGHDQNRIITLSPIRSILLDSITVTPYSQIERTWMGRLFISSKQKIQDINLGNFFVGQPFQYSIVPGLGTHGKLSAQVVNKFSLNILGGYSGGVNGLELGGLFNIDKNDVRYAQIAGLFNTVGGTMTGVQVAGLHNGVLDSVRGIQVAGLSNTVKQPVRGIQIAGIANRAKNVTGLQLAGIANISRGPVNGVQLAGILNRARNLRGWQIGLVNIADTSSGYSIGLVNVVKHHGYYRLSVFSDEAMSLNMALKTGKKKLYNILLAGTGLQKGQKTFAVGYGIGREFTLNRALSLTTELTEQNIFVGYKNDVPVLARLQPSLQIRLGKQLALFAGPSFTLYFAGSSQTASGEKDPLPPPHHLTLWRSALAWPGWQAGVSFFVMKFR